MERRMWHNLLDKKILTGDSDVISRHHCGLSRSVIHQAQFSEVFPRLELIHLKFPLTSILSIATCFTC